jgi:hypothetical protein
MFRDFLHHDMPTTIIARGHTRVTFAAVERTTVEKLANTIPISSWHRFQMQGKANGVLAFFTRSCEIRLDDPLEVIMNAFFYYTCTITQRTGHIELSQDGPADELAFVR